MFRNACFWRPAWAVVALSLACARLPVEESSGPIVVQDVRANQENPSLLEKAMRIEALIHERHLTPEGLLAYGIGLASPDSEEIVGMAFSDMAIWSGCYVASQAFRYAVTGDPMALERVRQLVGGLHLLQDATGRTGLLARGVKRWNPSALEAGPEWHRGIGDYSDYQWLGDVSVDQVDGVIFGYAVTFDLIEDEALRRSIASRVAAIADHIIGHGMTIQDLDGRPTKHGDLTAGLLSEPLNALIALTVIKTAYHMTKDEAYQQHYLFLINEKSYHKRAVRARDPWWEVFTGVNHSDNNLAFLAYYPLLRYEDDPVLLGYYKKSLDRTWGVVRYEGNPFFTFIYSALSLPQDRQDEAITRAVETLRLFPADRRNHRVINSKRADICMSFWEDRFGRKQSCRPVPMDRRPADAFEWKENPYRLDGGGEGNLEFSGVDFLLPYWIGRYHGFILE